MFDIPEHPVISNMMRTGDPDGKEMPEIRCPICGMEGEEFYLSRLGQIVGCDCCIRTVQYYELEME